MNNIFRTIYWCSFVLKKLAQANNSFKDKQSLDEKQICKKIINTKINFKNSTILKNLSFI